jgi:hypothetical protein
MQCERKCTANKLQCYPVKKMLQVLTALYMAKEEELPSGLACDRMRMCSLLT